MKKRNILVVLKRMSLPVTGTTYSSSPNAAADASDEFFSASEAGTLGALEERTDTLTKKCRT